MYNLLKAILIKFCNFFKIRKSYWLLPFVLIFTVVFAILQKTQILGKGKKQIDAIINALKLSNKIGMKSYAILGYSGGKAKKLSNIPIHFNVNDMQIAEDTQLIIGHLLMKLLNQYSK